MGFIGFLHSICIWLHNARPQVWEKSIKHPPFTQQAKLHDVILLVPNGYCFPAANSDVVVSTACCLPYGQYITPAPMKTLTKSSNQQSRTGLSSSSFFANTFRPRARSSSPMNAYP